MKSSDKSTTKKTTTKTTKKVAEPKTKETKTSSVAKKTTAKKVKDTEVKKNTKKEIVVTDKKEENKVTTKAKVAKADTVNKNKTSVSSEVLEKAVKEPKKTARKSRVKKEEAVVQAPPIVEDPVVLGPSTEEPVLAVPDHVTVITEDKTTVVNAVTPEKTVDDLINAMEHDSDAVNNAFKDVANTTPVIYDGYKKSVNGKIIGSFRKCIVHTESGDFFSAITFALHNRFQDYSEDMFDKVVDILDTSPSRFNVIIG